MLIDQYPALKQELKNAATTIEKAKTVLLISGDNPDGDSIGTMLALNAYCSLKEIDSVCFCISEIPENLFYLPIPDVKKNKNELSENIDLAITFDLGQLKQTGIEEWLRKKGITIINIDHHQTNDLFGTLNIVYPGAASTTELIYNFFKIHKWLITRHTATSLMTGLMTDTGNLSNPATSSSAMAMAADLIKSGGNFKIILQYTFKNKSLPILKLWGEVIDTLHHNNELGITTAVITQEHFTAYEAGDEWIEGLANFLTVLEDAKAILVLREIKPGTFKGSLRTTRDDINVERLACALGGGGHKKAAGFICTGNLAKSNNGWYIV